MTAGLAATHANEILNVYRATTLTGITLYVKLHTGDPGAAGTANASAVTTRNACTFNAAASGSISLTSSPTAFTMTATETLTHISLWDASSGGTFKRSAALSASKSVGNTDTFTLTTLTLAFTPLAA